PPLRPERRRPTTTCPARRRPRDPAREGRERARNTPTLAAALWHVTRRIDCPTQDPHGVARQELHQGKQFISLSSRPVRQEAWGRATFLCRLPGAECHNPKGPVPTPPDQRNASVTLQGKVVHKAGRDFS